MKRAKNIKWLMRQKQWLSLINQVQPAEKWTKVTKVGREKLKMPMSLGKLACGNGFETLGFKSAILFQEEVP